MRRARIQVKPVLNPRAARPTSNNNAGSKEGASKEDESHQKSAKEGTSGSVPAAVETNSSTSRAPNLNIRRPAFSVRPKPSLRALGVPNLHGTQPAPILVPPSQGEQPIGSGDAVEPVVKETNECTKVPATVPALLDAKEGPAATPEKEPLVEAKSADMEKDMPKDKEVPNLFQRRSKFQVGPKIQSNPPPPPPPSISSGLQPSELSVKENVPASEKHENKSSPLSNETITTSKSIPATESNSLPCSKLDTKLPKSTMPESPANQETDTSPVGADKVAAATTTTSTIPKEKEAADKEKLQEQNTEVISKPITGPHEDSNKTKLVPKPETPTTVSVSHQPFSKILSNETQTLTASGEVKSDKQANDTPSDNNSASKETKPVPVRRSRFTVQPKLGVKAPIRKPTTSQRLDNGQSLIHTQTAENKTNECAKDTTSKETAADSNKNESDQASIPRRSKFQVQPKLNLKGRVPLSSRLTMVDIQPDSLQITAAQGVGCSNSQDQQDAPVKIALEENIETSTFKSESTDLLTHKRFQTQPKPSAVTEPFDSSSKIIAKNLPTSQAVTTDSTSVCIPLEGHDGKEADDSENKATNKESGEASSKEMPSKVESTVLPRRKRFQIQPKPSTKTEQPDSSSKITAKNLPATQSVTTDDSASVSVSMEVDGGKDKNDLNKVINKDVDDASSKEMASKVEATILPRRKRFQVQPKPSAKAAGQSSATTASSSSSKQIPVNLLHSDTPQNVPSAITVDVTASKIDNNEPKDDDSENKDNNKDIDMNTKEMAGKIESTILPRRSRFQAQPKLRVKTTGQSPVISSKPSVRTLAADQPVKSSETLSSAIPEVNDDKQKNDSEDKGCYEDTMIQTPIISRGSNFKIQPKTNFKTAEQSSANLTKVAVSDPPENETQSSSLSTEATSKLESDGNNWRDESEVKDTNKDAKNFSTTLPRRNRFQIQPKPSAKNVEQSSVANSKKTESNQSVNDIPSTCTEAEISDADSSQKTKDSENKNDDTASKDATSKIETSVLPRRNRFQIQPRPSAKTSKPSSSSSSKLNPSKISSSPSISSNNDTTSTCSEDATKLETDDSQHKDETEVKIANKETESTAKELPLKRDQTPLPTLSRRSRFQVQPKVAVPQTKENQPSVSVNEENSKTSTESTNKSEATALPRRSRFQIQPKPSTKTVEQSSSMTNSKTESNQSVINDIPSTCVEAETSDAGSSNSSQQTKDSENKNDDTASKDATSKMEKTAVPTLSRRSRFQVRPKLGISKESLKGLGKPNEGKEKRAEKTPPKSTTLTVLNTSKDAKRSREDRQPASPETNTIEDELLNSESSKSSEKSDSSVSTSPGKLTGKSSLSSPLKDNIQIENIKQREYPVNVHKSSGKGGKSLPLREKQKKPDISVHPSDKPPDRAKMKMRDLIYWNPSSNPMKSPEAKRAKPIRLTEDTAPKTPEPPTNENEPIAVPQVKIGADGNIVLNEESLVINNSQPTAPISMEVVDETDVYSNYGSFRKYTSKSKWSLKDTKKFFLALSTVGTDFSLMTNLFTKKTRRDLKNKFKREERNNQWLVDKAIKQQLHFDEKLFEALSESDEEEEPPAKKSRQKKDSSESLKKKDTKSRKSKKATKSDTSSSTKKAKKPKKLSTKDWVIGSQEEESTENIVEEVVEEEPVHDEMLIVPDNTPSDDTLARMEPSAENQAKPKPTKVQKAVAAPEDQTQEEEVVSILMEMGQRGLTSPTKPSGNVPSSAQENPQNKAPAPTMPMINTHSTATAVASKEPEVAGRAKSTPEVPTGVSIPGSSGGSQTAAEGGAAVSVTPATEEAKDNGSLARLFLQQMGLNSQLNALQDEIVSITEAEISHNDQMQKVILVEVQPKDQKQTVVHMYLVSRTDNAQSSADGSGGQVTVSEAQPLALPPSMSCLTDTPPSDVNMASGTETAAAQTLDMSTSSS